jgi:hypothetical protein
VSEGDLMTFKYLIHPVLKNKHVPARADEISETGVITNQVVRYILESPLAIADLTDKNPNVYYE